MSNDALYPNLCVASCYQNLEDLSVKFVCNLAELEGEAVNSDNTLNNNLALCQAQCVNKSTKHFDEHVGENGSQRFCPRVGEFRCGKDNTTALDGDESGYNFEYLNQCYAPGVELCSNH